MQSQIDRYEVRAELARGGMAAVYHAYDPRFKREVAIKVLPKELAHDEHFRERFEREAQIVATLEHSAIVPVYDYGESKGQPYLVMRYMRGGMLATRIEQGPLELDEVAAILDRVAAALDVAHERGIIHRDIKPANVLFDEHGDAFLGDFGLVRMLQGTGELTGSGIVGRPAYMAPEMSSPEGLTPLIDVYALAAAVYEMVGGTPPYKAETPVGVMVAHVTQPIPDVTELRDSVPIEVSQVIMKGLAKKPEERYPTAGEMARDFRAALAGDKPGFLASDDTATALRTQILERTRLVEGGPLERGRSLNPLVLGGIGVGVLALIVLIIVVAASGGRSPEAEATEQAAAPTPTAEPPTPTAEPEQPTLEEAAATLAPAAYIGGGGQYIAYVSNRGGDDEIWLLALDTLDQIQLTANTAKDTSPDWSPDGTRIAFVSNRDGQNDIYVMNRDGSNVTRLTTDPASDLSPIWSPDGTQIAFTSDRDGDHEVYVMDLPSEAGTISEPRALTDNREHDLTPAWSPDGALLGSPLDDGAPACSPDGQGIAFISNRENNSWDIFVVRPDGSDLRNVTQTPAYDSEPFWSPDGQWIVFASGAVGVQRLFRIPAAGGEAVELTLAGEYYFDFPIWQPVV